MKAGEADDGRIGLTPKTAAVRLAGWVASGALLSLGFALALRADRRALADTYVVRRSR